MLDEHRNTTDISMPEAEPELQEITHIEGRACASVSAVLLSLLFAVFILSMLKILQKTSAPIRVSLLVQFMLRGGFLATGVALACELSVTAAIRLLLSSPPKLPSKGQIHNSPFEPYLMYTLITAGTAAFTEECSKVFAVLLCTDVVSPTAEIERVLEKYSGCRGCLHTCCLCRSVVESPRSLMLAGVAVGFGFMVIENVEYSMSEALNPGQTGNPTLIWVTGIFRVFFNLHWVFVGITMARMVPVVFSSEPSGTYDVIEDEAKAEHRSCMRWAPLLMQAIWPAVCLHFLWDVGVLLLAWQPTEQGDIGTHSEEDNTLKIEKVVIILLLMMSFYACTLRMLVRLWPHHAHEHGAANRCTAAEQ